MTRRITAGSFHFYDVFSN